MMPDTNHVRQLRTLFSDYRAEWSANLFGALFTEPPYFAKLQSAGPCLLIGGRGTGKTTSLRSLRFDASAARLPSDSDAVAYCGIYLRVNKNRVRAFQGPPLSQEEWNCAFAHYFNILACIELCKLAAWLGRGVAQSIDVRSVASTFGLHGVSDTLQLLPMLTSMLATLELFVNNPTNFSRPIFSIAEAPLRAFAEAIDEQHKRIVFCCIDEYENLSDEQQGVLNAYIKHSQPPLSYKIGVKRGGLRNRATRDRQDVLSTPDDYLEIDIGQENFEDFAQQVVKRRLQRARADGVHVSDVIDDFLPALLFETEAQWLGCDRVAEAVLDEIKRFGNSELVRWASNMPRDQLYFLKYWAEGSDSPIPALAQDWKEQPDTWATRLGNHGYASLFWLSRGRKGARIRKYYSGARTFLGLASGNIRYVIELIDESLGQVLTDLEPNAEWTGYISPEAQTLGAQAVGKRRLDQLEGLSEHGADIKRLVLALGKVFFEFARDPVGKTPEVNLFTVGGEGEARKRILALLQEGVSNLAFEAMPRTKATTKREIRDDEYRLHPIFAPFFVYSHRRKRRHVFPAETLLEVLTNPSTAVSKLLRHAPTDEEELPSQLAMFSSFYYDRKGGQ